MRRNVLVAVSALLGILACHSSSSPSTNGSTPSFNPNAPVLTFQMGTAPLTGSLSGVVHDIDSNAPIAGVALSIGGASTTSASDGTFTLTAPLGRAQLSVRLAGYVPSNAEIPIGGTTIPLRVNLRAITAATSVDATGASLTSGGATLALPPGAYASSATVSATWLDGAAIVAAMRSLRVVDSTSTTYRALGVLHVEASAEPTIGAKLTVPVRSGVDPTKVMLVPIADDGTYGAAFASASTTSSSAAFTVTHFSGYVEVGPADSNAPSIFFPQADPGTIATLSDGTQMPVSDGIEIPSANVLITAAAGAVVQAVDTVSETAVWYANTGAAIFHIALHAPADAVHYMETSTANALDGALGPAVGVFRIALPFNSAAAASEVILDTWSAQFRHDGTIFTVEGDPCPASDGTRTIDQVETDEGTAVVDSATGTTPVPAGQTATACEGCTQPKEAAVCCDATNCAAGCCQPTTPGATIQIACLPKTNNTCCKAGTSACGLACCTSDETCSNASDTTGTCCATGTTGCFDECCTSDQTCNGSAPGYCCPAGYTIPCGALCCASSGQTCVDGYCQNN